MLRTAATGALCGAISGLIVGIVEAVLGSGAPLLPSVAASTGLLVPVGLVVGLGVVTLRALLPERMRPVALFETLRRKDRPETTAALLVGGLVGLATLAVLYRICLFFLSHFHHHGLAAMSLAVTLVVFLALAILATRRLMVGVTSLFSRAPAIFGRPFLALLVVVAIWAVEIIPPLAGGNEATGVFGFIGLLRKDGLGGGPLLSVLGIAILSAILVWVLLPRFSKTILILAGVAVALGALAPLWAAAAMGAEPRTLDRIDSSGALSPLVGKTLRQLADADKDGHARWMGGLDCDDSNPEIHPGARDIPDNGVDEDCSGEDLSLAALKSAVAQEQPPGPDSQPTPAGPTRRPALPDDVSLVLITVDTLRWNAPGFMGYERPVSKNLDALVENGTIYERGYALGSYTGQAIPPMLTGKYASEIWRNNRHETRVSPHEKFAAEYVCGDKVRCGAVLSHFLFNHHHGWSQGFQHWEVAPFSPPGPIHRDLKYNSHTVADRAIKWLKKPANTDGQFWLWIHFMDPHKEYVAHKGFKSFGNDRRAMYDHEVLYTDYHIGRVLKFMKTLPAFERTIFMVSADHGEAFNEHGRWCHGKELWEEIIRVPLAVAGPGIAAKRISRQTSQIDLFPTIIDIFGGDVPEGIHGRSLLPDWVEGQELPERPVLADQPKNPYYETRRVYLKDGWKLHDLPDTGTHRLYRLTDDYERGESLVESEPEEFRKIKAAYDLFMATEFKPLPAVDYGAGPLEDMPKPHGFKR